MEYLIASIMLIFEVNRQLAYLLLLNITSIPLIIFISVRLFFQSQHFDVLKDDSQYAKKDAARSAEKAHSAAITCHSMMRSSSQAPPHDAHDALYDQPPKSESDSQESS